MPHQPTIKQPEKGVSGPGFISYLLIVMWFLLTIMAANNAQAGEPTDLTAPIVLTAEDILPEIEKALFERGLAPGAEIILHDPRRAFSTAGDITIAHVSYNERSGRFAIRLAGSAGAIAGVAQVKEVFPTLTRRFFRGDIIQEADIAFIEATNSHAGIFIRDAEDLIGKEARRPLSAHTPLRTSDLAEPVLIKKGALVTLVYDIEGLRLSHQGVALGAGGAGDVITVRNVQSERVLKAVVSSENIARVATPRARQSSLKG